MEKSVKKAIDNFLEYLSKLPRNEKVIEVEGLAGSGKTTYIYNTFSPVNTCLLPEIRIRPDKFSFKRQKEYLSLNLEYSEFANKISKSKLLQKVVLDRGVFSTLAYAYSQDGDIFLQLIDIAIKQKRTFVPNYLYLKMQIDEALRLKSIRDGNDKHPVWSYKNPVLRIEEFYNYIFSNKTHLKVKIVENVTIVQ